MTNTKRIAWFLSLQHVLGFPRHFLAPMALFFAHRGPVHLGVNSERQIPPGGHIKEVPDAWPRGVEKLPIPQRYRTSTAASSAGNPAARQSRSETIVKPLSPPARWKTDLPSAQLVKPQRLVHRSLRLSTTPGRDIVIVQQLGRGRSASSTGSVAPTKMPGKGLGSIPSPPQKPHDLGASPDLFSNASNSWSTTLRPSTWSSVELDDSAKNLSPQPQWSSEDPGDSQSHNGIRPSKPSLSTLHIDGSMLGRWAIQHLERALGRPATGMTGVDPRATVPRSRVAPF